MKRRQPASKLIDRIAPLPPETTVQEKVFALLKETFEYAEDRVHAGDPDTDRLDEIGTGLSRLVSQTPRPSDADNDPRPLG